MRTCGVLDGFSILRRATDFAKLQLVRMVVDYPNPNGSKFETEIYVPHHYIKFMAAGTEKKEIGFLLKTED